MAFQKYRIGKKGRIHISEKNEIKLHLKHIFLYDYKPS